MFGKPCIFFANANYFFHSLFSKRSSIYRRLLLPLPAQASSDDCDDDTDDNNFNEHDEIHLSSNFVLWVSSVGLLLPRLFLEEAAHDDRGGHYADQHSLDKDDPCCIFHLLSEKNTVVKDSKVPLKFDLRYCEVLIRKSDKEWLKLLQSSLPFTSL